MHFPEPRSCRDLNEELFAFYSQSADLATRLLDHMSRLSSPYDCEAHILSFFSRMVMRIWLPGNVSLTIIPIETYTACITLATEPNNDDPEIIYQNNFNVSMNTILEILSVSHAVLPFMLEGCSPSKVVLTATMSKRRNTLPPSAFTYADADIDSDHPENLTLMAQTVIANDISNTGVYLRPPPVGDLVMALSTADELPYVESRGRAKT
ncbi:MAG: hypothetical protein P1P90_04595 [Patescibacteria group bacterium]|nr:hypothetical protein [Patescibacteria group bacterium]